MVSIAYMDPGNYGTDIAAGTGYRYDLLWAGWLASGMAILLQYLSGKLGIATGRSLPELVRSSFEGKRRYVIPYWLAAEAAAAATDLAEYLGTVLALNLLFGIPLIYAAIFGALDVIVLLALMGRRFRLVEQYFAVLISILVLGIFLNLLVVKPDATQTLYHSVVPYAATNGALLVAVGMVGATVMPHALFVHSWLSKNKLDAMTEKGAKDKGPTPGMENDAAEAKVHSREEKQKARRMHLNENVVALTIAGVVNAGILLVATPFYPGIGVTISGFVSDFSARFGAAMGVVFVLTLLASGLSSSALGTIAGQVIMEGLLGRKWNPWARRVVTRVINVFPTTVAILIGIDPLSLLVYSQVALSLLLPLPMIPLVYYTSKSRFMGELVNRKTTIAMAVLVVGVILAFNLYLLGTFA